MNIDLLSTVSKTLKDFEEKKSFIFRKRNMFVNILTESVYDLPCPINLSWWWSFGSMLGLCLTIQLISGIFLSFHYSAHESLAFDSVIHIVRNVNKGWFLRSVHTNGASMFFICLYVHIARGIYYGSYLDSAVWNVGVILYLLVMGEAFLGYSLPWGQMSYWGVTVITNMVTVIPFLGKDILQHVLGGYSVCNNTLKRFYSLHFVIPFVIMGLASLHLLLLHESGSNNPLGVESDSMLIPFHPFYTVKDLLGFCWFMWVFVYLVCVNPELLGNPVNFIPADPMKTPIHVKPEWYFMFAYDILRSIPHKAAGVIAMLASILVLFLLPLLHTGNFQGLAFYPINQGLFWVFVSSFLSLTWIGNSPVCEPYVTLGRVYSVIYFSSILIIPYSLKFWDSLVFG
uniref:Cytochrome b n=2 Tax=Arcuatula senhousia TaxID=1954227 RepID=E2DHW7_ARCSE|nr:cytochrome b [Arcuatula senhousia]ACY00228.1 cytochrome b [Arcuatula senhousia]